MRPPLPRPPEEPRPNWLQIQRYRQDDDPTRHHALTNRAKPRPDHDGRLTKKPGSIAALVVDCRLLRQSVFSFYSGVLNRNKAAVQASTHADGRARSRLRVTQQALSLRFPLCRPHHHGVPRNEEDFPARRGAGELSCLPGCCIGAHGDGDDRLQRGQGVLHRLRRQLRPGRPTPSTTRSPWTAPPPRTTFSSSRDNGGRREHPRWRWLSPTAASIRSAFYTAWGANGGTQTVDGHSGGSMKTPGLRDHHVRCAAARPPTPPAPPPPPRAAVDAAAAAAAATRRRPRAAPAPAAARRRAGPLTPHSSLRPRPAFPQSTARQRASRLIACPHRRPTGCAPAR